MNEWTPLMLVDHVPKALTYNLSRTQSLRIMSELDSNADGAVSSIEVAHFFRYTKRGLMLTNSSNLNFLGFSISRLPYRLTDEISSWLAGDALGFWDSNGDGVASLDEIRELLKFFLQNLFRSRLVTAAGLNQNALRMAQTLLLEYHDFDF
jgi:hypothetical protein